MPNYDHLAQKLKEMRTAVKKMLRENRENCFTSLGNNFTVLLWSIVKKKSELHNFHHSKLN